MNTVDLESSAVSSEAQETANASSTYTVASINCRATTGSTTSMGIIENDSPPNSETNSGSTNQGTIKVFAPVITHDVTLPNTAQKVPMVMVPVPDSRTLMAIPISTLSQLKDSQMENALRDTIKDQKHARDLLIWNDGIGTLDGCDLRFKLNQLGCLELLDSDDESENQNVSKHNAISAIPNQSKNHIIKTNKTAATTTTIVTTNGTSDSISTSENTQKKARLDIAEPASIRQISPGSSLLRDGPKIRRPKSSPSANSNPLSRVQASSLSLLKKFESSQNLVILDKLVPKQRLDKIKTNVDSWTIEDVKNFVDSIPGCSGCGELFELQQICGKSLMYLDQRDLVDVINVKLGPAVKIYNAISLLK